MADLGHVVFAVSVQFPAMRRDVMSALAALADEQYQQFVWLGQGEWPGHAADLQLAVNVLFDDAQVLPEPSTRVGTVLVEGHEISRLRELGSLLNGMLERHARDADQDVVDDPDWDRVRDAASRALSAIVLAGGFSGS